MVTPTATKGWRPTERNWNRVPTGMVRQSDGRSSTVSSSIAKSAPHVGPPRNDEPDLLDSPVTHGDRCLAGG